MLDQRLCPSCKSPLSPGTTDTLCSKCRDATFPPLDSNASDAYVQDTISANETNGSNSSFSGAPEKLPRIPQYEILHEISRGGQGIVYQAVQRSTKCKVAIKLLLEGPYASRSTRRRFEREIELVASLKHPNIIAVFDSGTTPDGHQFYVMDYIRGIPIIAYIRQQDIPLEDALSLFRTICDAVNHAHQKGVIHRDLKPSNILVDVDGTPRILDFGLAKTVTDSTDSLVSMTGQVVGTLRYMSPEQTRGNPDAIDTRTDVYALGILLYEILTGAYPYPVGGNISDTIHNITHTPPASLSRVWTHAAGIKTRTHRSVRPSKCPLDHELDTLVQKALVKERERRYQSAGELSRDIVHYLADEPLDAKRDSAIYLLKKTFRRNKIPVAIAAAFSLLVVISIIALSILYTRQSELLAQVQHESSLARAAETQAKASESQAVSAMALETQQREEAETQLHLNRLAVARSAVEQKDFVTARKILTESPMPPALEDDWRWTAWAYLRASQEISSKDLVPWFPKGERTFILVGRGHTYPMYLDLEHDRFIVNNNADNNLHTINLTTGQNAPFLISPAQPVLMPGVRADNVSQLASIRLGPLKLPGDLLVQCGSQSVRDDPTLYNFTDFKDELGSGFSISLFSLAAPGSLDKPIFSLRFPQQITACASSHDGKTIAVGFRTGRINGYTVELSPPALVPSFSIQGYRESIATLAFSTDDQQLHAISDGMIYRVWQRNPAHDVTQIPAHTNTIRHLAFNADGSLLATGGYDGHAKIWSVASHQLLHDIVAHALVSPNFGTLAFFPDSKHLLTAGSDHKCRIWDLSASPLPAGPGKLSTFVAEFDIGHTPRGELSPDGTTLFTTVGFPPDAHPTATRPQLQQWDLTNLQHPQKVMEFDNTHGAYMTYNLRYLHDQHRLFAVNSTLYGGTNNHIACEIFDTSTTPPTSVATLDDNDAEHHDLDHRDLDVSPDASQVAISTWQGTVSLWDLPARKLLATLAVNPGRAESCVVSSVRFHPTLPLLVTACHDSRVTIFSTHTFRKLASIDIDEERQLSFGPRGSLKEAIFSPDGKTLAIGAGNDLWLIDLNFFDPQIQQLADERHRLTHDQ